MMKRFAEWYGLLNEAPPGAAPGGLASPAGLPPGGGPAPPPMGGPPGAPLGGPGGGMPPPPMGGGPGGGMPPPPMGGGGGAPPGAQQPVMKMKSPNVWDVLEQLLGMGEKHK